MRKRSIGPLSSPWEKKRSKTGIGIYLNASFSTKFKCKYPAKLAFLCQHWPVVGLQPSALVQKRMAGQGVLGLLPPSVTAGAVKSRYCC